MDVMKGTMDLLILRVLAAGPAHGWGIAQQIELLSRSLRMNQGSLYPALHKLEDGGLIEGAWQYAEATQRRVKLYHLTKAGRARLQRERAQWRSYVVAMELVLEGA
jgi:PadR family transcriptional regulator, regulatory protein PadR